ncbi:MAG: GDP-L-fucose synthase [Candidatus Omnitrophica bacterium]|nr:GDP-L-fucose synthase [Candidatus Omnitrophota bacterium]
MDKSSPFLIVGHGDVIEMSLCDYFRRQGFRSVFSSTALRLDVLDRAAVERFFDTEKVEYVVLTSVRSGGIGANQAHPAELISENLQAQNNIIDVSFRRGVKKLLFLAASCIYPKDCSQPIKEECFLTGAMEKTSEPYSIAKAAGVVMCQAYRKQYGFPAIVAVPATVYGPGGEEDPKDAHVLSAMIMKFKEALRSGSQEVVFWGSGRPRREFIFGDDLASACLFLLEKYDAGEPMNIGVGEDIEVKELAALIKAVVGFKGELRWDTSKSDGTLRKLLDNSRISSLGWRSKTSLAEGIEFVLKT